MERLGRNEGISDDVITSELDIELKGDTASKGSQSLPHIMAENRGGLSSDSREVQKHRKCIPQTELQDLHGTNKSCSCNLCQGHSQDFRKRGRRGEGGEIY